MFTRFSDNDRLTATRCLSAAISACATSNTSEVVTGMSSCTRATRNTDANTAKRLFHAGNTRPHSLEAAG